MTLGLDFGVGAKLAQREKHGDWYRDPWGWPELDWVEKNAGSLDIDSLILKSKAGIVLRTPAEYHLIEVPKNRLSARPAVVQDVPSRLVYLAAVATKQDTLHGALPDWVFGWRFRTGGELGDNRKEWPDYLAKLQEVEAAEWGLQADITSFFASINVNRLETLVYENYGKTASAQLIMDIVRSHDQLATRSGLPQRSFASAALAHLYLSPLDDVMTDALQSKSVRIATRWMDDINAIGAGNELYKLHIRLQARSRQLGLELNPSKSILAPADSLRSMVNLEDFREIDLPIRFVMGYDDSDLEIDPDSLLKLESQVLDGTIHHPTVVRAILSSLRTHKLTNRYRDWMEIAQRMPHLAEPLSLYLRTAVTAIEEADPWASDDPWEDMSAWLQWLRTEGWTALDWVDARYALIFPAGKSVRETESLKGWLKESPNLQKVAIAAQRLSAIDPAGCRDSIRTRIDHVTNSQMQRALALGLLSAGGGQTAVRDILQRDRRNALVLAALENRNWQPFDAAPDFNNDDPDRPTSKVK